MRVGAGKRGSAIHSRPSRIGRDARYSRTYLHRVVPRKRTGDCHHDVDSEQLSLL